jgi:hypothetical protein
MIPEHILFSIASFLNFSFILDCFPHLFQNFAKHNKIELLDDKDLQSLTNYNCNFFIKHLVYYFKPSEEDNDKMESWLIQYKIKGGVVEIPFYWKGRQLIQISAICNKFKQVKVNVHSHRVNFKWNLNVLGNVFSSMKNKQFSFILNGGSLYPHIDCYFTAETIQALTLNNVFIFTNYNIPLLRSKVKEFYII